MIGCEDRQQANLKKLSHVAGFLFICCAIFEGRSVAFAFVGSPEDRVAVAGRPSILSGKFAFGV